MKTTPISTIMTRQVHSIGLNEEVGSARNLMDKYEIHHLPVVEDNELVGILSKNDINQISYLVEFIGQRLEESTIFKALSIQELMSENVRSLDINASIEEAVQIFSTANFQSLPVTDNHELVGIITTKDIFDYFLTNR